jgi:hypothetical protein
VRRLLAAELRRVARLLDRLASGIARRQPAEPGTPPEHWVAMVRSRAPGLLRGEGIGVGPEGPRPLPPHVRDPAPASRPTPPPCPVEPNARAHQVHAGVGGGGGPRRGRPATRRRLRWPLTGRLAARPDLRWPRRAPGGRSGPEAPPPAPPIAAPDPAEPAWSAPHLRLHLPGVVPILPRWRSARSRRTAGWRARPARPATVRSTSAGGHVAEVLGLGHGVATGRPTTAPADRPPRPVESRPIHHWARSVATVPPPGAADLPADPWPALPDEAEQHEVVGGLIAPGPGRFERLEREQRGS